MTYDPAEIVNLHGQKMPLLSAFQQVIKQPHSQRLTLMIRRDEGRRPLFFDNMHIEEMAADPNFRHGGSP
jgi:hypothetical protein